ncbi:thymidylate synthase [Microcystis phage Mel-JY01]
MKVKLSSITMPMSVDGIGTALTPEQYITYIARISNPSNQKNVDTSEKLIKYLIKHKHWSPFEFVDVTFYIETRRSISAQIIRHRSFVFQEFSLRYSSTTKVDDIELRRQSEKNRQSSSDVIDNSELKNDIDEHNKKSIELYEKLLKNNVAREVARDVLPLSTGTQLFMKGSIRSWIHYIQVRTEDGTQKEHREIAEEIKKIFISQFPIISSALGWTNG